MWKSAEESLQGCNTSVAPAADELLATHMFVKYSCSFDVLYQPHVSMGFDMLQLEVVSKSPRLEL
jgi:hypothetical protein